MALGLSAALVGCSSSAPQQTTPAKLAAETGGATDPLAPADAPNPNGPWVGAAAASDAFVAGWQDTFVAVWVDVPNDDKIGKAPAAVSLVIDTSGSMAGDKIRHAREAASRLVSELRDGDIVNVVTFSDQAVERVAPTRLDAMSRQRIASVLAELRAEGGTNLFEGVRTGGMAVMGSPATHPVRRVVLISDGIATVGMTSRHELGNLGEKAGDRGVQLTAIGVGLDYDEQVLNQLAIRSSGRLYHLSETRALPEIIAAEMNLLKSTRATNVRVSIVPAPGVQLVGIDGARGMTMSGGAFEVPLGAMFGGQHKEFVVRVRMQVPAEGSHPVASVRLLFQDPTEQNLERVQEAVARFDVVNDPMLASQRKNERAQNVFAMIDASKFTDRAAQAINADDFSGADRELAQAEERLRAQASAATSSKDKKRLEASAAQISQARKGAGAAAKAPPAARPAAKRDSALKANEAAMDMQGF
jgi:Ca-activated chloride channel family protein